VFCPTESIFVSGSSVQISGANRPKATLFKHDFPVHEMAQAMCSRGYRLLLPVDNAYYYSIT